MHLNRAIELACIAHAGQVDHFGVNIVQHAIRVMQRVQPQFQIPAVLHDVVEDSPVTLEELRMLGVSDADVYVVDLMTHRKSAQGGETYFEYIDRMKHCPAAIEIKLADLADNMDIKRGIPTMPKLFLRYIKAMKILKGGTHDTSRVE